MTAAPCLLRNSKLGAFVRHDKADSSLHDVKGSVMGISHP